MPKTIIFVSTEPDNKALLPLLEEMGQRSHKFIIYSPCPLLLKQADRLGWENKKTKPSRDSRGRVWRLVCGLLAPLAIVTYWLKCLFCKYRKQASVLIIFGQNKKTNLSRAANLAGLKVIWAEQTLDKEGIYGRLRGQGTKRAARSAHIVVPDSLSVRIWEQSGPKPKTLNIIPPGIKTNNYEHQDNLFATLAKYDRKVFSRRFFTLITETDLDQNQQLNVLFQAIAKSLDTIPHLQLMIIGDGPERKNLIWLSQKLGIDNLVWFVGKQDYLGKWLEDSDIFVASRKTLNLTGWQAALESAGAGLPVIAAVEQGLEDLVVPEKNGILLNHLDSELLTQAIIRLEQNNNLRKKMGQAAQATVTSRYNLATVVDRWENLL
jgi:glycosyltransferase involved in cell wall biosynthesis